MSSDPIILRIEAVRRRPGAEFETREEENHLVSSVLTTALPSLQTVGASIIDGRSLHWSPSEHLLVTVGDSVGGSETPMGKVGASIGDSQSLRGRRSEPPPVTVRASTGDRQSVHR